MTARWSVADSHQITGYRLEYLPTESLAVGVEVRVDEHSVSKPESVKLFCATGLIYFKATFARS